MDMLMADPIGLIADSHGRLDLMEKAIAALRGLGAHDIVHLGDICDSLAPLALEEALPVIENNGVRCVLGNNEYAILVNHRDRGGGTLSGAVVSFLESLPYVITAGDVTFAHAAPYPWPAALRWPHAGFPGDPARLPGCRVLFRGHSHTPSVLALADGAHPEARPALDTVSLEAGTRYVVTVGAVEKGACALYDPRQDLVRFIALDGRGGAHPLR